MIMKPVQCKYLAAECNPQLWQVWLIDNGGGLKIVFIMRKL